MFIKTERLILKPYSDKDRDAMIDLLTNSKIKKTFMIPELETEEKRIKMFNKIKSRSVSDEHYEAGIFLNDILIGFLNDVEVCEDKIELGYVINPQYHNCGYATEALKAFIDYLFERGFSEIIAGAFEDNASSIKVMLKCGMKQMKKQDNIEYQGIIHHCSYYSISRKDVMNML